MTPTIDSLRAAYHRCQMVAYVCLAGDAPRGTLDRALKRLDRARWALVRAETEVARG